MLVHLLYLPSDPEFIAALFSASSSVLQVVALGVLRASLSTAIFRKPP
jgi:hypothetical protein